MAQGEGPVLRDTSSRSQDGNHREEVSSLGKGSDWMETQKPVRSRKGTGQGKDPTQAHKG